MSKLEKGAVTPAALDGGRPAAALDQVGRDSAQLLTLILLALFAWYRKLGSIAVET